MKLLLALALAFAPAPSKTLVYEDATITAALPAGMGCGIRKMWGAVDFKTPNGFAARAYVMCATTADDLPRVGARCALTVTVRKIDGGTPDRRDSSYGAYAVDEMTCDPPVTS